MANYYNKVTGVQPQIIPNYPVIKPLRSSIVKYDIIYQGAINEGRCLKLLVETCIANNFSLCICGSGDLNLELLDWIGKASNIEWRGEVKPEDLHTYTTQSAVGFNVLDNSSLSYDESMPNKTFDYIMAGIPQIISSSTQLMKLNNEHQFAFTLEKLIPSDLATLIKSVKDKNERYLKIKENCLSLRQKWNWEAMESQLISFYKQL